MSTLDEKNLHNVYLFDKVITETLKTFFQVYNFKQPPKNKFEPLTEIIRSTVINVTDGNEKFYLDDYCRTSIYHARFYVHTLVLFFKGYETVKEFYDVDYNVGLSEDLPPKGIERSAKVLIQALHDYYFDVMEFITNGILQADNFNYLVRFIVGDCVEACQGENVESEELFLLVFQEKAYGFAKFMATYLALLNNEPVRVRGNANLTSEEKVFDWLINRGK